MAQLDDLSQGLSRDCSKALAGLPSSEFLTRVVESISKPNSMAVSMKP